MTLCTPLAPAAPPPSSSKRSPLPILFTGGQLPVWIGGYIPSGKTFKALLVGVWERKGLRYIGCLQKNWSEREKAEILAQIEEIPLKRCPFHNLESGSAIFPKGTAPRWLFPSLKLTAKAEDLTPAGTQDLPDFAPFLTA
ncbi:hypothetical protein [Verrucomicrobium sp. BvORR034]|uniref:ATP dependent DNA ligase n=1 Tax=Verrucomicrobium sp. BvORR034 TaxID=1396418 RepID=UPI000678C7C3|nr:hypothetical protein [Verrucomicrobium sp. BvORR034]